MRKIIIVLLLLSLLICTVACEEDDDAKEENNSPCLRLIHKKWGRIEFEFTADKDYSSGVRVYQKVQSDDEITAEEIYTVYYQYCSVINGDFNQLYYYLWEGDKIRFSLSLGGGKKLLGIRIESESDSNVFYEYMFEKAISGDTVE